MINIEVVYASTEKQVCLSCDVADNCSVKDAILQSGIMNTFPEIDIKQCVVGIFSQKVSLDTQLRDKDRIEIYRPLLADPKQKRRARATLKKN